MPRWPQVGGAAQAGPVSPYASAKVRSDGEVYPFHVGDTWLEPAVGCRSEDLTERELPGLHRYAPVPGLPELREALAAREQAVTGVPTRSGQVLVTAGATGGLAALVAALIEPGDEVLILAPYWPLIAGVVRLFQGVPVPVPVLGSVSDLAEALQALEQRLSPRTAALYLSTPNNPTGLVLPPAWVQAMAAWAQDRGLWLFADEVYDRYVYEGEHAYARATAPEHTVSCSSFSKAFGMAGNRVGYLIGPEPLLLAVQKMSTHLFYAAPTNGQRAALRALGAAGDHWVARARESYREIGDRAASLLGLPGPQGGTFLFFDAQEVLDDGGLPSFLAAAAERGLLLAPGPSFGPYTTCARLCFTAAPPSVTERGVHALASLVRERGGRLRPLTAATPVGDAPR